MKASSDGRLSLQIATDKQQQRKHLLGESSLERAQGDDHVLLSDLRDRDSIVEPENGGQRARQARLHRPTAPSLSIRETLLLEPNVDVFERRLERGGATHHLENQAGLEEGAVERVGQPQGTGQKSEGCAHISACLSENSKSGLLALDIRMRSRRPAAADWRSM